MTLVLVEIGELDDGRPGARLSGTAEDLRALSAHLGAPVAVVPLVELFVPFDKAEQAARCPCRGADDWCVCQNVADAETRRQAAKVPR